MALQNLREPGADALLKVNVGSAAHFVVLNLETGCFDVESQGNDLPLKV